MPRVNAISIYISDSLACCIISGSAMLQVCIATGKARGPWCKKVLPKMGAPMPGVYMQGLLIYNGDGSLMHEESLSKDLVRETIKLAKELGTRRQPTQHSGERQCCLTGQEVSLGALRAETRSSVYMHNSCCLTLRHMYALRHLPKLKVYSLTTSAAAIPALKLPDLLISFAIPSILHTKLGLCPSSFISCADITLVLYSYDRILAEQTNQDSDRLLPYEDPTPESVGDLENVVDTLAIQKCIMIASEDRIGETREQIAKRLGDGSRTSLTVAIAGMLEVGAWTACLIALSCLCVLLSVPIAFL